LPLESCIGNHDIWGWNKKDSGSTGNEVNYGKAWALEALGLEKPYRSFDRAGWHFVVLDSVQQGKSRLYDGRLDEEQFEWLKENLQRVNPQTPVCILSHIPIMCASIVFYSRDKDDDQNYRVAGSNIHMDALELSNLFLKHPNVKLCLSGHIHQTDRIDYNGVTYLCNGAVSGGWWKGKHKQCDNGYAMIDLYDDGSFEQQYVTYGWKPRS
jgi:3',5'-cyclic AMP phosphodiesterase CpdA